MAASLQTGPVAYLADRKPSLTAAPILASWRLRGRSPTTTIAAAGKSEGRSKLSTNTHTSPATQGHSTTRVPPGTRTPTGENMTTTKKSRAIVGTLLASAASVVG